MLKAQKLTLAVLISAAIISSAQASEQSEAKGFVEDANGSILFRTGYLTRDKKQGAKDTSSVAQSAIVSIESGFTPGIVGFGVGVVGDGSFKIGENSKIGAGSVVLKEVPANCTVVGVPGRIVKQDGAKIPRMDMNQVDLPDPISNDIKELQVDNLRMHKKLMELENQLKMVAHAQCAKEEKEQ